MLNLPRGQGITLPDVPSEVKAESPRAYQYLVDLRRNILEKMSGLVDNDTTLQNAINTGASGTFVSSGVSFVFVNGIFTSTV